jgi:predicted DNA-binding WGR domain protein
MKTFIYHDEKSHKFWAIDQQGNELHLRWGKVGTNGQSQIKTFADTAAASKAGQKLINEKTRKGYVEEGEATPPSAVSLPAEPASPPAAPQTEYASTLVDIARPWLADDAELSLSDELLEDVLPSRRFPGKPIAAPGDSKLMNLGKEIHKQSGKTVTFNSADCSAYWQQTINEALTNGQHSPAVLAVQVAVATRRNWRSNDNAALMDQIVYVYGLEYAVETFIALQHIEFDYNYQTVQVTFRSEPTSAREPGMFDVRLRTHLAQAEESLWQKCVDKLIAALADMPIGQQPLVALLLPDRPDIVHDIARRVLAHKNVRTAEWLKLVVRDPLIVKALEPYQAENLFNDYYHGRVWNATVMREQGVAGIARFAPYAHDDLCGELVSNINHPQALMQLIRVSEQGKRCHERMTQTSARFPHAALAALAELLVQKEQKRWRIMLMTLLSAQPELVGQISPWLSAQAATLLEACQQQLNQQADCASDDMLPAVLVSPPWVAKKKKSPIAQLNLAPLALEPVCMLTEEGSKQFLEQRSWCTHQVEQAKGKGEKNYLPRLGFQRWNGNSYANVSDAALSAWRRQDYPALIAEFKAFHGSSSSEWALYMLTALPTEQALQAWNALSKEPHIGSVYVMAHLRLAGLPGFIHSFSRYPQENLSAAIWFAASELAPIVARAFNKLKSLREGAREWLLAYPEHAITGLLPAAFSKTGEAQDSARLAIRMLVDNGHQQLLEEVARRYNQPEVTEAVNALLALDPLDNHPSKIPPLPAFYQPALWARTQLRENGLTLPDAALKSLGEMLRFPSEGGIYPGLQQVKALCTAESLAAFAWDLFSAWQTAGAPSKESWAFTALGIFGNDDTARALTPLIRAWPGESQHKRATVGLDILAAIGTDIALMQLNGIAQKLKFKALQERARKKIGDIAESRGLTIEELEDRLAPDLGLNDDGTLTLDFGPRRFIVSFDEALKPYVRDESGSRLKDLPKPNKSDDNALAAEAVNRYKALKKDARTISAQQIARMESAMCHRRRWTAENFQQFLVNHPLVRHLTRRLVWGVYSEENVLLACFRVAEDNSYSNADDDLFSMPDGDIRIGLPHLLEMPPEDAAAFGQLFADYELLPPFRQLDRNCYTLTPAELAATELTRWAGRKCPSGRVIGLANKGWLRGDPQDAGWIGWMLKPLGQWALVMEIDEGFAVGMLPDELSTEQLLSKVWLYVGNAYQYGWGSNTPQQATFSVLDKVTISELINDIDGLFG